MRIKKTEIETFIENTLCPECNIELEKSDEVLLTNPPQYQYSCPKCNYTETSFEAYPKITYEEKANNISKIISKNYEILDNMNVSSSLPTLTHTTFSMYGYDYDKYK
jgi:hypothetical protein